MSQHNAHLPPPPPTPRSAGDGPGFADSYAVRRRPGAASPPSITTNFLRVQGGPLPSPTPISGGTSTPFPFSPSTPVALNPRVPSAFNPASHRTPNTAMEPYNPRQWSQSRTTTGAQMVARPGSALTSTLEATGMEASMPSPPPPYSTDAESIVQRVSSPGSGMEMSTYAMSPSPMDTSARSSPHVPMSPAFPPPPSAQSSRHRDRSASGLAGTRAFLSNLRGKLPAEVQASNSIQLPLSVEVRPPAARRAASTGQMQLHGTTASALAPPSSERSSPDNRWQPGMPLPGPPPGPPPPGTRSQSLNRYPATSSRSSSVNSDHGNERQQHRRTAAPSTLGPVPPTPAGWVDGQETATVTESSQPVTGSDEQVELEGFYQPLRIDTGAHGEGSMTRRAPTRDLSASGLRERRSRSRKAKEPSIDITSHASDDTRPRKSVLVPTDGAISRRREHMRAISGYTTSPGTTGSSILNQASTGAAVSRSADVVPTSVLTPPYTPAVKKAEVEGLRRSNARGPSSAASDKRFSHLLHTPNDDGSIPAPLSPARPQSASSTKAPSRLEPFFAQAMERHRSFIEKEAAATSDEERLELFANFMVHESRLRRDRYQAAYNAMAGDIVDMTRDMWRSYTQNSKRAATPSTAMSSFDPTAPSWASDGQSNSAQGGMPSSASSFGDFTPATDAASLGDPMEAFDRAESRQWTESFKPTLSPIPSMAQSSANDGSSSRGRTASRWWEPSNSGSGSIGRPERIEKSRRETKYMGVKAAELIDEPSPALSRSSATPGASALTFGENENPPEKVGWHESADFDTPQQTPSHIGERKPSASDSGALDVSRLVTLPPPYPRHHPAISNSHPLLAELRNDHRAFAEHSGVQQIKDAFLDQDFAIRQQQRETAKERKAELRSSIQLKIADGTMSFQDAAQAETEFDKEEADRGKANARGNFERFETHVAQPVNTLVTERIAKADACIMQLRNDLESHDQTYSANQAQEEGDEHPERLEKLTLLKWLFEAREQLHKEMYDLHAERSDQYSEVILTPYRILRAQARIDEAAAFFAKDSQQRQTTSAQDALRRLEELQRLMETNVSRGVEDQLSAFWDIAPNLMEVITRVPFNLSACEIHVPVQEYDENPSYLQHPLQYLYSLLNHAGKSTYQFIESQTNLLCLLHEVRTAATKANLRLLEVGMTAARSLTSPNSQAELRAAEQRLTADLQDKVREVESQWKEALGDELEACKERVRVYLEANGGWEDGLED